MSEIAMRIAMDSAKDIIFTISPEGTITSLNTVFESVTGSSRGECLRKPLTQFLHPDDVPDVQHCVREVIAGRTQPIKEFRLLTKTGECRICGFETTVHDKAERAKEILVIARDVTEEKRAEQRIQMFAHTITSMHECVVITDRKHRIIFINPAFVAAYGYREEDIIGKEARILSPPESESVAGSIISKEMLEGGWHGEIIHIKSTGEIFPVMVSTSTIFDPHGTPIAFALISRDITEQRQLRQQLDDAARQREEDLQRFALSVQRAHEEERQRLSRDLHDDLGQVVTLVRIDLERAMSAEHEEKRKELINHALNAAQGVLARIHEIAVLLRPPIIDDFGLKEAIETYLEDFESKTGIATESSVRIGTENIPKEISTGIYRILQEALTNVSKHSGATSVHIQLESTNNCVKLSVEDEGCGFTYATSPKKRKPLGLLGMKERAELMGGTFTLETSRGQGTKIHIVVPIRNSVVQS
ncbi:MAG: PAS domain S-box protein [Ignavibacteriae bacterium]|nr:PAS domain S-box protein [Ignavibacteria bacterium]MBI3365941.1 PAS domain S-box protein [Ignavibacteriota bacterium]